MPGSSSFLAVLRWFGVNNLIAEHIRFLFCEMVLTLQSPLRATDRKSYAGVGIKILSFPY